MIDIIEVGEKLIKKNAKDQNWDKKLQKQNRQTYALLDRFLKEECELSDLAKLRQTHLSAFVYFLHQEIYVHYGKSLKDFDLTIEQLRAKAAEKEGERSKKTEEEKRARARNPNAKMQPLGKRALKSDGGRWGHFEPASHRDRPPVECG